MTRRDFMVSAVAMAGMPLALSAATKGRRLRVGILSDIHVDGSNKAVWFEKSLRYFDAEKVDAVLVSGDLTVHSQISEHRLVADTWFKVFPGDCRSDGTKIERLFITGNHDVDGWAYGRFKSVEEARPTSFFFHREEFWQKLWKEDYKPVSVKTVKGYTFVLRNWLSILGREAKGHPVAVGFKDDPNPLDDFLSSVNIPSDKPVFFVQHEPLPWPCLGKVQRRLFQADLFAVSECVCADGAQSSVADGRDVDLAGRVHRRQLLLRDRLRLYAARAGEWFLRTRFPPRASDGNAADRLQGRSSGNGDGCL